MKFYNLCVVGVTHSQYWLCSCATHNYQTKENKNKVKKKTVQVNDTYMLHGADTGGGLSYLL